MPKNIVVFADGTGQEGGQGNNTNPYKLFNIILDRSLSQIAFYDRGLGTGWRKLTGNVGGRGFGKNLQECYEFIFDNYQAGDQIYLFGFSRGAATVRSLSVFIHMFGILPKSRRELIKQAYGIYKIGNAEKRDRKARRFLAKHHTMGATIRFIGVWDTVAALGLPIKGLDSVVNWVPFWKHKFHNYDLSQSVEYAYHALSIDDERKTFHPVLWDQLPSSRQPGDARKEMQQVWFCGMHTDVGGGYEQTGLSDIALEWMVQKAVSCGLHIYPRNWANAMEQVKCRPNADGFMHNSRRGIRWLFRRNVRRWNRTYPPTVHKSVTLRKLNRSNEDPPPYSPWILNQKCEVEPWPSFESWRPDVLDGWCDHIGRT